jgi:hypothetical protein
MRYLEKKKEVEVRYGPSIDLKIGVNFDYSFKRLETK